jgi:dihydroorotate dehydrogenase (NAD+) catalytic subunit
VTKTVTVAPRQGNPPPRLWETPGGMVNSIGLPNKGLDGFLAHDLPELAELPVPLVVSVMGFDHDELARLVETVGARTEVSAIELNVSCPNVETGVLVGADPGETDAAVRAVRERTGKPLVVKLSPNSVDPAAVALAAEAAGADAISLINTLKGMPLHPRTRQPWLGGGTGGLSGPAVRVVALEQVAAVARAVNVPIVGMGGIASGSDALDFLSAGASVVAVGTESFRDPSVGRRIGAELFALGGLETIRKGQPVSTSTRP